MKRLLLSIILFLTSFVGGQSKCEALSTKYYVPYCLRFGSEVICADFPGIPETKTIGIIQNHTVLDDEGRLFVLSTGDRPMRPKSRRDALKTLKKNLNTPPLKAILITDVKFDWGYEIHYWYSIDKNITVVGKLVATSKNSYNICVTNCEKLLDKDAQRFMSSFRVIQ